MKTVKILLNDMSLAGCQAFLSALETCDDAERYIVDCSGLGETPPFAMLLLSYRIALFRQDRPQALFELLNHERYTYAAHMGFFRAFGAPFGNPPGAARGSSRYIPVTIQDVATLRAQARDEYLLIQSVIERESKRLAAVLTQAHGSEEASLLAFTLQEVMRNVVEHINATQIGYCAQYWPSKGTVEMAVLDNGIGVCRALAANPHWTLQGPSHALHLSLLPGVSGKAFAGAPFDRTDPWQNAGFGLFMTSELARRSGSFLIASGGVALVLKERDKTKLELSCDGTIVRVRVSPSKLRQAGRERDEIIRAGEKLATRLRGTPPIAHVASKLVREGAAAD